MGYVLGICRGIMVSSTAWYGDDSSWNEGPCQDQYEEMAEEYIDETKDAEQVAMEMQAAYLAGEESGDMTTAFKGKGKPLPKEKARATEEKKLGKPKEKSMEKDDQVNYPWKIDERSWRNSRRKRNSKLVYK